MKTTRTTGLALALVLGLTLTLGMLAGAAFVGAETEQPMTIEETEATLQAYADALLGGGPYETYFADEVVLTVVGAGMEAKGPAAAKQAIDALHHEQFDATIEVVGVVVGEGTAALEAVFTGTHTGEFAGIPATGKDVSAPYSVFYEFADGKITSLRIYGLVDALVRQLQPGA